MWHILYFENVQKKGSIFSFYYVDDCMIVSHKKETNTSLIESLYNFSKNYVLTDEGDISNYFGVNIKINSDGTFKLSLLHLVDKIINHVVLTVFTILKAR